MTNSLRTDIETAICQLEGWATIEKAIEMAELIKTQQPDFVVEIGVFGGKSLIPQALALRENGYGIIVGIDPWRKEPAVAGTMDDANRDWWAKVDLNEIHIGCMDAIWSRGLDPFVRILRMTSEQASTLVLSCHRAIGILHVDGSHTPEASCYDVQTYVPYVRSGGFIWFDDVDWTMTQQAIAMLDQSCKRVGDVGTCRLYQKP